jgi:hypothetical protein
MLGTLFLAITIGISFLGALSRFTHGRHTPAFYRFQTDRSPDNESTRFVPVLDTIVGTLLLLPRTRTLAAGLCTLFWGVGLQMRLKAGRPAGWDAALVCVAALTLGTTILGWS